MKVSYRDLTKEIFPHEGRLFKGVGLVKKCTVQEVHEFLDDFPNRWKWDSSNEKYAQIEVIDKEKEWDIVYTASKGWGNLISSRDFITVRSCVKSEGRVCSVGFGLTPDLYDATEEVRSKGKEYIRGITLPCGFEMVSEEEGVRIQYCIGVKLFGWIPGYVVNTALESTCYEFFQLVRKHFEGN